MTFAEKVGRFNRSLNFTEPLPEGVAVMNPFEERGIALECADAFYQRYYADEDPRMVILGINPGRHGAGQTGVPFTDFKRLEQVCGIPVQGHKSHEPSSEFVYAVVAALGGPEACYSRIYINSVCPLGFLRQNEKKAWINYNYYDDRQLLQAAEPFILRTLRQQLDLGLRRDVAFVMGAENLKRFSPLNEQEGFFKKLVALPHPRWVVQYQRRHLHTWVEKYVAALGEVL